MLKEGKSSFRDKAAGEILRRVLTIVDILAPYRKGIRADEIYKQLLHAHGLTAKSTLYRDLNSLAELGFVEKINVLSEKDQSKTAYLYRLDLDRTKHLQQMAISLDTPK